MIESAFPHPDDRSIIVHAWGRGRGRAQANATAFIPWTHVTQASRGWRAAPSGTPRWRNIRLESIDVLSDIAPTHLKAVGVYATEFERMIRGVIGGGAPRRAYLVKVFAERKEFCAYAAVCGAANAMSFYDPRTGEIVMWFDATTTDEQVQGLLAHEFTHAYMDLVWNRTSPLWFAEGMAEYFQNFSWEAGEAKPGQVAPAAAELLRPAPPMDLAGFVRIPRDVMYSSVEFPRLYAQAWSVVHFLFGRSRALVTQLLAGRPVDVAALEPEWRAHLEAVGVSAVPQP